MQNAPTREERFCRADAQRRAIGYINSSICEPVLIALWKKRSSLQHLVDLYCTATGQRHLTQLEPGAWQLELAEEARSGSKYFK